MPIYAYKCDSCGHQKDVLQKVSDPVLTQCPSCGAESFRKQVTAAGFQLKGSGWYVTDFRGGNTSPAKKDEAPEAAPAKDAPAADKAADKATDKAAAPSAAPTPAPAPAASPAAAPAAPPPSSST